MKLRVLAGLVAIVAGLALMAGCDDGNPDQIKAVAFTPIPVPTPLPKLCGNGVIDENVGEQCDPEAADTCGAGKSCVCCVCLAAGEELGERVFSIARPPSRFLSTGLAGGDVSTGVYLPGPIVLSAGRPDPDLLGEEACSATVTLAEDAIFGFGVLDGTTLCNKLFAEGATGDIDCDGGTAHDVLISQNSNGQGAAGPVQVQTGLGDPIAGGPGALTLKLDRLVSVRLPFGHSTDDCATIDYENALAIPGVTPPDVIDVPIAFTTKMGTVLVTQPSSGGKDITLASSGENFECGSWNVEDSKGILVGPLPGLDTPIGDTADMFFLSDAPK